MDRILFFTALGAVSSLVWPWLPDPRWGLPVGGLACLLLVSGHKAWAASLLGCLWCLCFFHYQLSWWQRLDPDRPDHIIEGRVLESRATPDGVRFVLECERLDNSSIAPRPRLRLTGYRQPLELAPGDHIRLTARLKPLHGLANPAGFNTERHLLGRGITATGSVREVLAISPAGPGLRARWLSAARARLLDLPQAGLLLALVFGEQQAVSPAVWQQLRETGLIHLMSISGLHIGLAAALGLGLARLLLCRCPGWRPVYGLLPAGVLALLYAWLAGFSLPTQRALLMLGIWMALRLSGRLWPAARIWLLALVGLLLFDTWGLFSSSLWLSFMAVALIYLSLLLWRRPSLWRLQLLMLLGLLPLQLALFDGLSLVSLPVNLVAIPLFCLLIIPLALGSGLLAPVLPAVAGAGFWLADRLLGWVMGSLDWGMARVQSWYWLSERQQQGVLLCWLALLLWRLPQGRSLAALCGLLLALLLGQPQSPWQVAVIDVGQGLSVLVQQGRRALLYDTGDAYPGGYNLADAVILPLLRYRGIEVLDFLVVSHKDRDHAANWQRLSTALPIGHLLSSAPLSPSTEICRRGQAWQWGELSLRVLWPVQPRSGERNEDSCVLQISDGHHRLLLTGDLQGSAEASLVRQPGPALASDLLVSPHHGSRTSSSPALIRAVAPKVVVHSAGYANRWHFPHQAVLARYQASGAVQWNTGRDGLVQVAMWPAGPKTEGYRLQQPWYRRLDAWLPGRLPVE